MKRILAIAIRRKHLEAGHMEVERVNGRKGLQGSAEDAQALIHG